MSNGTIGIGANPGGFASSGIFSLASARLSWLDQRQAVLAANVANADTPGWRPRDLQPFDQVLSGMTGVTLAMPTAGGIPTPGGAAAAEITLPTPTSEGPNGNAVALDRQISAVANTDNQQQLAVSLYQTYLSMFTTALGAP